MVLTGDWDHPDDDEFSRSQGDANNQDPGPDINVIVTVHVTIILIALAVIAWVVISEAL